MKSHFGLTIAILFCLIPGRVVHAQVKHPAARASKPNVLLITIDTVRADHLGCYGYSKIQTPTLNALAHDGIVFERAISQVPLTTPSHRDDLAASEYQRACRLKQEFCNWWTELVRDNETSSSN